MKCVTNGSDVKRVSNDVAMELTKSGWFYCPKALWKEKTGRWSVDKAFSEMEKSAR
jgi:hypothetical protein